MFSPLAALIPVGAAALHAAITRKWSKPAKFALAGAGVAVGLGLVKWQMDRVFQKQPSYVVIDRQGDLEIRMYPQSVFVRTDVNADFENALDDGFRKLFEYIGGANEAGEKISMTSPVTSQRNGNHYTISFFMPPERSLESLPQPTDANVKLELVPERTVAVMTFTGRYDAEHVKEAMTRIKELTQEQQLKVKGKPVFAAFDAPSTIPVLRHNEVWSELNDPTLSDGASSNALESGSAQPA
ncbi:MAG: SOUL family heme-binding protein [Archangium sp.]